MDNAENKNTTDEVKAVTFRIKTSVAEKIKNMALVNSISQGDVIEDLLNKYPHKGLAVEKAFMIGCINKLNPEASTDFKRAPFIGRIDFASQKFYFKPASSYAEALKRAYKLNDVDLSEFEVGSTVSIAEMYSNGDDSEEFILQETLILKEKDATEFSVYSQWVKTVYAVYDIATVLSPFVSQNDIVAIASLYAEDIFIDEVDSHAPDFGN